MTAIYAASDDLSDLDAEDGPLQTPTNNRRLSYGSRGNATSSSANSKRSRSPVFVGQQNEAIQELLTRSQERDEARAMSKRARVELEKKKMIGRKKEMIGMIDAFSWKKTVCVSKVSEFSSSVPNALQVFS